MMSKLKRKVTSRNRKSEKPEKINKVENLSVGAKPGQGIYHILLSTLISKPNIMESLLKAPSGVKVGNLRKEEDPKSEKQSRSMKDKLKRISFPNNFQGWLPENI